MSLIGRAGSFRPSFACLIVGGLLVARTVESNEGLIHYDGNKLSLGPGLVQVPEVACIA
jgi:hypothetical protein